MRRAARLARSRHAWITAGAVVFSVACWALLVLRLLGRP